MKKLTGSQVRSLFLEYFKEQGHMIEPGASLVPHNDPTLLWINAGVAALKKYFDGSEKPSCNRIANAQKCIRTNDIENVGKTARHQTFFEMLGNFSIGDYFKKEAIPFAWNFLTDPKWIGFDKEKMYITIYPDDSEAYRIWTEVCHVDPSHILKTSDNFWQIGEGPSGPDSEIFYDRGEKYDPEGLGEKLFFDEIDNDRYIEVWNVVFSQYDAKEGVDRKDFKELPQKNIDTGMGLERLVSIVQEGETNFDTDLFLPIIRATEKLTDKKYEGENKMAFRVIADHVRTVTFALADGAMFANTGRGYILRRVLRRAIRYGKTLNIKGAYMYKLVPVVADVMKDYYPYLQEKVELIQKLVKADEESFQTTLNDGEKILQEYLEKCDGKVLDGALVFKLYDTYGFPLELTQEIAQEKGIEIDLVGFNENMEQQKQRARNARSDEQSMSSQSADLMNYQQPSTFVGYEKNSCHSKVIGLFVDGIKVDRIEEEGDIILDQTPFYAESGGQVGDTGTIIADTFKAEVCDVQKAPNKQHLHHVKVVEGVININDEGESKIDETKRLKMRSNHSSLHLLQSALIKVLGNHIQQAGSYVCDEYARFDFTHFEKVNQQQIEEVEQIVNQFIAAHYPITTEVMSIEQAKGSGAIALFDEKYGDNVRVVTMGIASKELCGGTHAFNTADLGIFKIVSEESIGSGIRRITVKTGYEAYLETLAVEKEVKSIAQDLKMNSTNGVVDKVEQVLTELSEVKKQLQLAQDKVANAKANEYLTLAKESKIGHYIILKLKNEDSSKLKGLAESLANKLKDGFVFVVNQDNDKLVFAVACCENWIQNGIKAGAIAKQAAQMADGNGGGKDNLAQSGGKDVSKVADICQHITSIVENCPK